MSAESQASVASASVGPNGQNSQSELIVVIPPAALESQEQNVESNTDETEDDPEVPQGISASSSEDDNEEEQLDCEAGTLNGVLNGSSTMEAMVISELSDLQCVKLSRQRVGDMKIPQLHDLVKRLQTVADELTRKTQIDHVCEVILEVTKSNDKRMDELVHKQDAIITMKDDKINQLEKELKQLVDEKVELLERQQRQVSPQPTTNKCFPFNC